jgi:hypothetical protein
MSESRQDKRKYEPIQVEFNHYDTGKTETVGIYGAQAKFLYSFGLSSLKVSPLGAFIMIAVAFLCEQLKWNARDICLALNGRQERKQGSDAKASDPTAMLKDLDAANDEEAIRKDAESVAS